VHIRLRLVQALEAQDVGAVLEAVERPTIDFAEVYGAAVAKAELQFIVRWLRDPGRYKLLGLRAPRGILLYGAPGTGKTLLARALAGESQVAFLATVATQFVTLWQGSGPQNVQALFERARRYAPTIVFIDEIDAIGRQRIGSTRASEETLNALLTEMDGFRTVPHKPVIVLAATNLVELLDGALRRRFDREIEVDKPDRVARQRYLQQRLSRSPISALLIERLAAQSAGMTIADLDRVLAQAGRIAVGKGTPIDEAILEEAFERLRLGEARATPDAETLRRLARHEAGHCLLGWLGGQRPLQVSLLGRGHVGGYVEHEAEEGRVLYTQGELEARIRQVMGGRAAEILYYGEREGLSIGAADDLRLATQHAERMVRELGMAEGIGPLSLTPEQVVTGPLAIEVMRAMRDILQGQLDKALEELRANREVLDTLVEQLMAKNQLTRDELEMVLGKARAHRD
jgi:cell division protease FtsH